MYCIYGRKSSQRQRKKRHWPSHHYQPTIAPLLITITLSKYRHLRTLTSPHLTSCSCNSEYELSPLVSLHHVRRSSVDDMKSGVIELRTGRSLSSRHTSWSDSSSVDSSWWWQWLIGGMAECLLNHSGSPTGLDSIQRDKKESRIQE